jgi:hypothetical protein
MIALAVGAFALISPAMFLESKGITVGGAVNVWMREVGVLLISVGVVAFLVRNHEDSATLRALFIGNIIVQLGLLVIEPIAYSNGVITKLSGVVPNTMLNLCLAIGFVYYAAKMSRK